MKRGQASSMAVPAIARMNRRVGARIECNGFDDGYTASPDYDMHPYGRFNLCSTVVRSGGFGVGGTPFNATHVRRKAAARRTELIANGARS